MAYKNDSYLVIANKFSSASGDAKAQLWETYDQLRDLTVSGNGLGSGFGATGGFFTIVHARELTTTIPTIATAIFHTAMPQIVAVKAKLPRGSYLFIGLFRQYANIFLSRSP